MSTAILFTLMSDRIAFSLDPVVAINLIQTNTTWKASDEFVKKVGLENLRKRLGVNNWDNFNGLKTVLTIHSHVGTGIKNRFIIPSSFDARKRWPKCSSISRIRDQGNCGNCWAVAGCSAFSDRLCIASGQRLSSVQLSHQQVTFCCTDCGNDCNGGYIEDTWVYFKQHGVVTGGDYSSQKGCQPYEIPPLNQVGSWFNSSSDSQSCVKNKCTNPRYKTQYENDLYYTRNVYIVPALETAIQLDILINGPVQTGFDVYEDFFYYSTGIYRRNRRFPYAGGHALKIIGWGVDRGVKYWICSNSWSENWGEQGTVKVVRGENECLIEDRVIAGLPRL